MPAYPGAGQATMINANKQKFLWQNETVVAGTASVAFMLEKQKSASYPHGFAVEIAFSGDPGTFEVDIQGAETDQANNYTQLGVGITQVNSTFVGRFDGAAFYTKFVRALLKTL